MKKVIKKISLIIMLLFTCIVFTGCGGDSNSYDNAFRINVSGNIINDGLALITSSRTVASGTSSLKLSLNGVEFPGLNSSSDGNYIFTKVMYEEEAYKVFSGASATVRIISVDGEHRREIFSIVFEKISNIYGEIFIKKTVDNTYLVTNGAENKTVIMVNGVSVVDVNEINSVEISKLSSLSAKVTFRNVLKESLKINYDYWKISALDSGYNEIISWTNENNSAAKKLDISFVDDKNTGEKYYTINLTSEGILDAKSHNLDNTIVKIDKIRKDGLDIVNTGILEQSVWDPYKK